MYPEASAALASAIRRGPVAVELTGGGIESQVRDLEGQRQQLQSVPQRQVIGIGAGVYYTIYDPGSDHLDFLIAGSRPQQRARGFA